ncbi:hypothetical protein [Nostoc sp. ChiQUE01b]|uniref:hypothetical protein n=1 Tax=Nostoc sp. ChiQUE01b TaxID=3075376 RepID=UPI002AD446E5|nr:hypothetical protein [Nostoc sp. ChiQUE01b]MDZ8259465.1 hypothetical protein [Nostoc sp. ChiQUE01b]
MTLILNSPSNSTARLKSVIKSADPNVDQTIVNELCRLTEEYDLKWTTNSKGENAIYIMSSLSVAKGLSSEDYLKNWANKTDLATSTKERSLGTLAGKACKLEGQLLIDFKARYAQQNKVSLGKIKALWVGDFLHAYSYLTQGSSQAAQDFQTLGSLAIETSVKKEIEESTHTIEPTLQLKLMELAGHSNINLKFEVPVYDTFNPGSHRRFDFVEQLPKVTKIYELKSRTISEENVKVTILDKHYIELALQHYKSKPIELVFTSPVGISWEAKSYIQEINDNASTMFPGAKVKVSFIDTQAISERLVNNYLTNSCIESHFWFKSKLIKEGFNCVVGGRTIEKLNNSIVEAYRTGRLIKSAKTDNVIQLPILKSAKAA